MNRWIKCSKPIFSLGLITASFSGLALLLQSCSTSPAKTIASTPPQPELHYSVHSLPTSEVHVLSIPAGGSFVVTPAVAETTASLETLGQDGVAALNAGFFDPQNQQSTSYITVQGNQVADPTQNDRLINNPELAPYLNQILNRSELRRYQCQEMRYDIVLHNMPIPAGCELEDALGAGPQLLPKLTAEQEGFTAMAAGTLIRDAIGSTQPNARTAIGLRQDGSMIWLMAAQKPGISPSGLTLAEVASFLQQLGATAAINLDGGSSSALFYQGRTIYGKLDTAGNSVKRSIKSALVLKSQVSN